MKLNRRLLPVVVAMLFLGSSSAQAQDYIDLSAMPLENQFEFVLGDWTYEFSTGRGTASYSKAENDDAIRGAIEGVIGTEVFAASSLTYPDASQNGLQRRWVDSMGNVLTAVARVIDYQHSDLPALASRFEHNGVHFQHVWYNVTHDRFETDLLASQDGGSTWTMVRRMPYIRVAD